MVKPKLAHLPPSKVKFAKAHESDEWVIVKKQKINILIPPLVLNLQNHSTEKPEAGRLTKKIKGHNPVVNNNGSQKTCSPNEHHRYRRQVVKRLISSAPSHATNSLQNPLFSSLALEAPKWFRREVQIESSRSCLDVCEVLQKNRTMRALNLERKLQKAGGVSPWLVSLGLGKLEQILRKKNVSKFQLLNLTMDKLKHLGADAVGPRRKLMHAIDCLYQSYCFRASLDRYLV